MLTIKAQDFEDETEERNWNQIRQQLQLRELPDDQIPRLFYDAIQEIFYLQNQLRSLRDSIQELWHHAGRPQ